MYVCVYTYLTGQNARRFVIEPTIPGEKVVFATGRSYVRAACTCVRVAERKDFALGARISQGYFVPRREGCRVVATYNSGRLSCYLILVCCGRAALACVCVFVRMRVRVGTENDTSTARATVAAIAR